MHYPSKKDFLKLSRKGNLIPIYKEVFADLETPVSAYMKVSSHAKYSVLLESVEGQEKVARYSFIATNPELIFKSKDRHAQIMHRKDKKTSITDFNVVDTPFTFLREIMSRYKFVHLPDLPRFCGGLIGYIGYDTVRFFENLPSKPKDDTQIPDIILVLAKNIVIFDHLNHSIKVVSCVEIDPKNSRTAKIRAYRKAVRTINNLVVQLEKPLKKIKRRGRKMRRLSVRSNFSEPRFKEIVRKAKKEIRRGEIIQGVLSQRFKIKINTDPLHIYRTLRSVNPSPYMYYLNFDGIKIIGSSPELLVRCEDGVVETRPIAGTRPRGKNEKRDRALAQDLLNDPKEKAEHIMLVDLGRNDLGRVCEKGSVALSEFMNIEKYSHVMHIVSNVKGILQKNKDIFDVLKAAFPAGTVTGAPKIRAMEIIDELENVSRGPYAGCIGYFSFSGNLDTCITIRTIVATKSRAYVQAGAGIVADSNPKNEYKETVNKAKAQIMAIDLAHQRLD